MSRFRSEALASIDQLAGSALMWPQDEDAVRRYVLQRYPYTVFYEVQDALVTVLAVAHQRRMPGYWHER